MTSTEQSAADGYVILRGPDEWIPWLRQLKLVAEEYEIWDEINPTDPVPPAVRPLGPTDPKQYEAQVPENLNDATAITAFDAKSRVHDRLIKGWERWRAKHQAVKKIYITTVSTALRQQVELRTDSSTLLQQVKALQSIVGAEGSARKTYEEEAWRELVNKNQCIKTPLKTWLTEVELQWIRLTQVGSSISVHFYPHILVIKALFEADYPVYNDRAQLWDYDTRTHEQKEALFRDQPTLAFPRFLQRLSETLAPKGKYEDFIGSITTPQPREVNQRACYGCHEIGHVARNCFFLKRAYRGKPITNQPKEKQEAVHQWLQNNQERAEQWFGQHSDLATELDNSETPRDAREKEVASTFRVSPPTI